MADKKQERDMYVAERTCPHCNAVGFLREDNIARTSIGLTVINRCASCHNYVYTFYKTEFVSHEKMVEF